MQWGQITGHSENLSYPRIWLTDQWSLECNEAGDLHFDGYSGHWVHTSTVWSQCWQYCAEHSGQYPSKDQLLTRSSHCPSWTNRRQRRSCEPDTFDSFLFAAKSQVNSQSGEVQRKDRLEDRGGAYSRSKVCWRCKLNCTPDPQATWIYWKGGL